MLSDMAGSMSFALDQNGLHEVRVNKVRVYAR